MKKMFRLDGYQSAVLGNRLGLGARLNSVSAPYLYGSGGVFARIVDKPADDAVSGRLKIHNDTGVFQAELDRLGVMKKIADAVRWARLTGGGAIVPIMDDAPNLQMPLNAENIGKIRDLRVYGADQVQVSVYNDYGQPVFYIVQNHHGSANVHYSRLITVPGEPMPFLGQVQAEWIGRNVVERAYESLLQNMSALKWIERILERKQQPIYNMVGLSKMIELGFENLVQQRINLIDEVRNILQTIVIDGGDGTGTGDSFQIFDLNVSGLGEVVNLFKEQVAADAGLPITLLFGRSAAGMNATGEGDLRAYYDLVGNIQNRQVKPALEKMLALIAAQKEVTAPENWEIEFLPLYQPTAKEAAEIAKIEAETLKLETDNLVSLVNIGAISELEAREYLHEKGLFVKHGDLGDASEYAQEITH